jgi:hypothetical protein
MIKRNRVGFGLKSMMLASTMYSRGGPESGEDLRSIPPPDNLFPTFSDTSEKVEDSHVYQCIKESMTI